MFQSIEFQKHLGYDEKTKQLHFQYKVIDSEFEFVGDGVEIRFDVIEQAYKSRGYSKSQIAKEMFRFFYWYSKKYGYELEEVMYWFGSKSDIWDRYKDEIEKFLILV